MGCETIDLAMQLELAFAISFLKVHRKKGHRSTNI